MKKVLFVNHDVTPYVEETELAMMGKMAPKKIQEAKCEIRTFMPRWGNINERRGQLHEVIRLSGQNIPVNDNDHPIIIKVATIQGTKVQVYFIDNEELFSRKAQTVDKDGKPFEDNGERAAFYARAVIETLKKLRWVPDVIHCQGWMTALIPLYLKKIYKDDPDVCTAKVVTSIFKDNQDGMLQKDMKDCIVCEGVTKDDLTAYNDEISYDDLIKIAADYSDGIIATSAQANTIAAELAKDNGVKVLEYPGEDFAEAYKEFYDTL